MSAHALLSASSAHRWLACPPSARAEERYMKDKEETQTVYAREGTLAHDIAQAKLEYEFGKISKKELTACLTSDRGFDEYYQGMEEELQEYIDFCIEEKRAMDATTTAIEHRVDYSSYAPEGFGTADCILIGGDTLHVIDLKFGKGVRVSAFDNPQLKLYALGALEEWGFLYEIETVKMTIAQVRLGNLETFQLPVKRLKEWGEKRVKPRAKMAYAGKGDRIPGENCRFCKIRRTCKPRAEYLMLGTDKDPQSMSTKDLSRYLEKADQVKAWAKELEDYAKELMLEGKEIEGWKLVEGVSRRQVTDEEGLIKRLIEEGYDRADVLKPAQIETFGNLEKLIGRKKFLELSGDYVEKPAGKPKVAPADDRRPEYSAATNEFEFEE